MKLINEIKKQYFETERDLLIFSKNLENHSIKDLIDEKILNDNELSGKGGLGQIIEKLFSQQEEINK